MGGWRATSHTWHINSWEGTPASQVTPFIASHYRWLLDNTLLPTVLGGHCGYRELWLATAAMRAFWYQESYHIPDDKHEALPVACACKEEPLLISTIGRASVVIMRAFLINIDYPAEKVLELDDCGLKLSCFNPLGSKDRNSFKKARAKLGLEPIDVPSLLIYQQTDDPQSF